jgi:3-phenylpropionate/trans-cinnamate dioxygenase ferredoxin reductase subunit
MSDAMIIVGAGQAGGRAALTLREQGYGGRLLLLGAEADPPYERPPLSKGFLTGQQVQGDFTFAKEEVLRQAGIDFRPGCRVEAIHRQNRTVRIGSGEQLAYDRLLLATGRRVRRLPVPAPTADRVCYLRDLDDARLLQAEFTRQPRLAIVGGGFIGLEVAASAAALGCRPIVLELAPQLMGRVVPPRLAAVVQARHEAAGVTIRLGVGLEQMEPAAGAVTLRLTDGSRLTADLVLVGIGAVPRTELAEAAGLAVDGAIIVDATLATSDPRIFAAGDVCACPSVRCADLLRLESWQNADAQGSLAARSMLGAGLTYGELPWFWSDQHELTLQIAGHPELATRVVERGGGAGGLLLFHLDHESRLIGISGVGPVALAREFKLARLLLERNAVCDAAILAEPSIKLKALLR